MILLIPFTALLVVIISFLYFSKRTYSKYFQILVLTVFTEGFIFNYVWELMQFHFYLNNEPKNQHVLICTLASIADAIMILVLYFTISFIYKSGLWIRKISWRKISIVILIGASGAILFEKIHLWAGNWRYTSKMPLLPVFNVGFWPVMQFIIFPLPIFWVSNRIVARIFHKKNYQLYKSKKNLSN